MIPPTLDTILVITAVVAAAAYLIARKVRSLRRIQRDWASGHADSCDHCPAIQIRQAQVKKMRSK